MSNVVDRLVFGGRWEVDRELSKGGMGVVYFARHTETGRPVALKVIKPGDVGASAELVARFKREIGALAAVSHPNVVGFLDCGIEQGTLFLVMELLHGRPLRDIMKEAAEPQRALRVCADVCRALAAVHQLGIVHRDLKPENVFLVDAVGHEEHAKLIDFGIVRLESAGHGGERHTLATMEGMVVGTPGYISPEQLQGQSATAASDVYAVGVILYELLTGKFPFEAPTTTAMLTKQLIEPLPPPRMVRPSLPQHVEDLVLLLMARDPTLRVSTAEGALSQILAAEKRIANSLAPAAPTEHAMTAPTFVPQALAVPSPAPSSPAQAVRVKPQRPSRALIAAAVAVGVVAVAGVALVTSGRGSAQGGVLDTVPPAPVTPPHDDDASSSEPATPPTATPNTTVLPESFAGTWKGSFTGEALVQGRATSERGSSDGVRITSPAPGKLDIAFTDGSGRAPCTNTLVVAGPRATFSPPKQRCTFEVRGGRRASEATGALTLQKNGSLVFDVGGGFTFYPDRGDAVHGTFKHRWSLHR